MIRYLILFLMIATNASAFDFSYSFNFNGGQQTRYIDIVSSLLFSPTTYDFGSKNTGTNTDQVFTITGVEAEEISLSVSGTGYSELSRTCAANPFDLLTGDCTVTVRFTPATAGTLIGALTAAWTNQSDVVASLTGVGVDSNPPTTPVISVTPSNTQNVIALTSGGVGATSFNLLRSLTTGTETTYVTGVTLPYTNTGLTNGTPYYYQVAAINSNGTATSTEVSGTPTETCSLGVEIANSATAVNNSAIGATNYKGTTFTDTVDRTICALGVYINSQVGTPTYQIRALVYLMSGNNITVGSPLATSAYVPANSITTSAWNTFTFPTPYTMAANNTYAIVIQTDTLDGANYFRTRESTSDLWSGGSRGSWNSGGSGTITATSDLAFRIYY